MFSKCQNLLSSVIVIHFFRDFILYVSHITRKLFSLTTVEQKGSLFGNNEGRVLFISLLKDMLWLLFRVPKR